MALSNRNAKIYIQHFILDPDKTLIGLGDLSSAPNCLDLGKGVLFCLFL